MGWISTDNEHEGWVAAVAPDGRLSSSSTAEGMLVEGITGHYKPAGGLIPGYEIVPDADIMGWRGACECGWQGQMWVRVATETDADFSRRREYLPLEEHAFVSGEVEDAIHEEWKAHASPSEAVIGVRAAAREFYQAGRRLDKTVAAAKAAGATWADIGRAAGMTRQAAHERWADK